MFTADLQHRLSSDDELRELGLNTTVAFGLTSRSGASWTVSVADGHIEITNDEGPETQFGLHLDEEDWNRLLASPPLPRQQHVAAFLAPRGSGEIIGNIEAYAQHLHLVRRVVELARGDVQEDERTIIKLDDVTGRYVRVSVPAWGDCDVYYESTGTGTPVILLPTAGSDCGQYHGLMSDPRLTQDYRLIAFDLPWHGKSLPPGTQRNTAYTLDTASYTDCIAGFIQALHLEEKPVLVGASMAGAVVVEMAALHPTLLRGVVSSQAGPRVANRHTPWLRNPKINQTLHVPEWTYGLMSPQSPKSQRDRVWWGYSLGGFSIYEQDINYYSSSWDIDRVRHLLDEQSPLAVLMNGIYDYSVPPEATQELQRLVPNSIYREMPELGHFPHAENPRAFAGHLLWALAQIQAHDDRPRPVPTTSGQSR